MQKNDEQYPPTLRDETLLDDLDEIMRAKTSEKILTLWERLFESIVHESDVKLILECIRRKIHELAEADVRDRDLEQVTERYSEAVH